MRSCCVGRLRALRCRDFSRQIMALHMPTLRSRSNRSNLEIIHSTGREVVTVNEVLSPANKTPGVGYQQYRKQQERSRAHLVEIDLLSQGLFALAFSDEDKRPDDIPHSRYLISVSRAPDRTVFDLYPLILPDPLPTFRIPLRAPDPDVLLNLQAVFDKCYENGGYADVIDYTLPPPAPLSLD